jgi:hypothetical protein
VQINFIFSNFRILHSSCNVKKPKTNVKCSKKSWNKHRLFYTFPLKLVQINFIFSDNVRILYISMMTRQKYVWLRYRWKHMHSIRPTIIDNSLCTSALRWFIRYMYIWKILLMSVKMKYMLGVFHGIRDDITWLCNKNMDI